MAINDLLDYKDNFEEYLQRTLKELLEDCVQYVELRTSLKEVSFGFSFSSISVNSFDHSSSTISMETYYHVQKQ